MLPPYPPNHPPPSTQVSVALSDVVSMTKSVNFGVVPDLSMIMPPSQFFNFEGVLQAGA